MLEDAFAAQEQQRVAEVAVDQAGAVGDAQAARGLREQAVAHAGRGGEGRRSAERKRGRGELSILPIKPESSQLSSI